MSGLDTIFTSPNIKVVFFDGGSRDVDLITFTPLKGGGEGFAQEFFKKRGISCICFISSWDHWWQTPEMADAVKSARGIVVDYKRAITYGTSMGAYGALNFSKALGANQVIAFSPQYSIHAAKVPFEKRWRSHAAKIDFQHDDMENGIIESNVTLLYDPASPDGFHAQLISKPGCHHVRIPFVGHSVIGFLSEIGMLKRIVMDLVEGQAIQPETIRAAVRGRRKSSSYWKYMGDLAMKHGRFVFARHAYRICVDRHPRSYVHCRSLALACKLSGQLTEASGWYCKAAGLRPQFVEEAVRVSIAAALKCLSDDDVSTAMAICDRAVLIEPSNLRLQKVMSRIDRLILRA